MPIDTEKDTLETALKKLKAKENSLLTLESVSKLGGWEVDLNTKKTLWSDQTYKIYGLEKETTEPSLDLFLSLIEKNDLQKTLIVMDKGIKSGNVQSHQCKVVRPNGEIRDVLINGQVVKDEHNNPIKLIGSTQDITEYINSQRNTQELSEIIEHSSSEISIIDAQNYNYLYANKGARDALGYSFDELFTMTVYDTNPALNEKELLQLKDTLKNDEQAVSRTVQQRKNGSKYNVQSFIQPIKYKQQDAYVLFGTDITKQVEYESKLKKQSDQLQHQAHHDTLTNLPNRTLFRDRLDQSIISSKRHRKNFALLFIDLDQFKKINDSLGHHIGDELLIEAASRLKDSIREEDTLARLGGDEFTIILKDIQTIQDATMIAEKIVTNMKQAITIQSHTLYVSSSIGISLYPQDSTEADDLLKFADTAMYKAKDEGRDNYQFYSSDMTALAFERVVMESSLRMALKEDQFIVYFQPQFNIRTNKVTGMEALIRWQHPQLGLVPPAKFIPLAEESGLIIEIDRIVMHKAMEYFSQWYKDGLKPGKLSLNLAMKQLAEKDFITKLITTMGSLKFQPSWLALEVTEGQIMNHPEASIKKLNQISDFGIELAIDDFGTGYSSLAYLKKLPLDKLKIDQSFVRDIDVDEDDAAITKAIIALGNSLNMKLIAEGVETIDQRDFLLKNGCEEIQGYLYSKPLPAEEIRELLQS